ncbi:MAG: hypothetical protein KGJ88_02875 [Verrucomicrobiota bacterium]|nr:hypothetical protein [Verrucomicrobiota bacterium]
MKMLNYGGGANPAAGEPMKTNPNPEDAKLSGLLREARVSPPLPPRFQERVWRRIEAGETPATSGSWLDALAILVLRPRFACATVTALMLAGIVLGTRQGAQIAKQDAQARYVAMAAPDILR